MRLIALFRGINVGKAKRVAMGDLRALFEKLSFRDPRTLLNSGNVVFSSGKADPGRIAARIEKALTAELGVASRVTVLSAAELSAAVAGNPLGEAAREPARFLVAFLRDPGDRSRLTPLAKQDWGKEKLALGARVAYLWCPDGILESKLGAAFGKLMGEDATTRNWATVLKLDALARAED